MQTHQNFPYSNTAPVEFNFGTNPLRTFEDEKGIWFCLKDACDILEIENSRDVVKRLDPKGVDLIEGQNGYSNVCDLDSIEVTSRARKSQMMTFVNEPNLYRVIFRSD